MDEYSQLHRRCSLLYSSRVLMLSILLVVNIPKLVSGCHEEEREALLKFKRSGLHDPANRLSSWGSQKDCCSWAGVGCNNTTTRVVQLDLRNEDLDEDGHPLANFSLGGKIDSSLIHLQHLTYLDLSGNNFSKMIAIPEFFGSFEHLEYLNLSFANFVGKIPRQLGNLSNLHALDLRWNSYLTIDRDFAWVSSLSSLHYLGLSRASLSYGEPYWLTNLSSLTHLYLRETEFQGSMPPSIGNLTNLEVLDLSYNSINGMVPRSFRNLCHLRILRLERNSIRGMEPLPRCLSNSLKELNLGENQLMGELQVLLGEFSNSKTLKFLDLSYNSLSGYIPYFSNSSTGAGIILSYVLEELYLDSNKLSGHIILQSIGKFSNLVTLNIYQNSLPIIITEDVLSNLQRLEAIELSNNCLVWKVKSQWLPPNVKKIYLSSSQVGPKFPSWLQHHHRGSISKLYMSNASISDDIPSWFWKIAKDMEHLDLSHNQLRGYLPNISPGYEILNLSNNSLSGPIPEDLCMLENLQKLDLSSNHFHGEIPDCWGKGGRKLWYMDLSNNNLSGDFPHSLGDLPSLAFLHMRNNSISQEISLTNKNMKNLVVLDLAYNRLSGVIPTWGTVGEKLPKLRILSLRSNMIHGNIPFQISQFSSLQFLDLSCNMLSGAIPTSLENFTAMTRVHNETDREFQFQCFETVCRVIADYVWMNLKGVERDNRGTLGFMNVIDLSSNNLSGDIPQELTHLLGLVSLNLSGNSLKGGIPNKIGELRQLESLDLSRNKLSGEIPWSISNLYSLSKLNLSYNNLSGIIPTGHQLQTLNVDSSIYVGNDNLCGPPLLRKCSTNEPPPQRDNKGTFDGAEKRKKQDEIEIMGLYISIALGFVVGFWGFCGLLIFKRSRRILYYQFVDEMMDKVFVAFVVRAAQLKRKFSLEI